MNSQGIGTNSFTSWYRNFEASSSLGEEEKAAVESFVDDVYEKIEDATGTDFMNNEGAALYRWGGWAVVVGTAGGGGDGWFCTGYVGPSGRSGLIWLVRRSVG